jgi:hypothetical protein
VSDVKRRIAGFDAAERDQARAEFTVELGSAGHDAAPAGIAPGRLGGRIGVGEFSEMMRMRPACARMPPAAMAIDLMKSITARPLAVRADLQDFILVAHGVAARAHLIVAIAILGERRAGHRPPAM